MPSVNFVESKIDLTLWIMEGNYSCKWVYCPLFQTKHNRPPHSLVQLPKLHYGLWQAQVLLNGEHKKTPHLFISMIHLSTKKCTTNKSGSSQQCCYSRYDCELQKRNQIPLGTLLKMFMISIWLQFSCL
jgi:hypothetical protein